MHSSPHLRFCVLSPTPPNSKTSDELHKPLLRATTSRRSANSSRPDVVRGVRSARCGVHGVCPSPHRKTPSAREGMLSSPLQPRGPFERFTDL